MPTVNLPDGRIINFPDTMTEQEIVTAIQSIQQPGQPSQPTDPQEPSFLESAGGALETGLAVASGITAEPIAGLAGIATAPFQGSEQATENIQATREALTFQPRTEAGQRGVRKVGEFFEPVAKFLSEAEKGLGDSVFEATGSPALAAAAATIPTIASDLLGAGLVKGVSKVGRLVKERKITKTMQESAPEPEQLFDVSRGIYNELDDLGVTIKPQPYNVLVQQIGKQLTRLGIDKDITPKSTRAFNRLVERIGDDVTLTELDTLRSVAKGAANDVNFPQEVLLGNIIIENIDTFLTRSGETVFNKPKNLDVDISKRFKAARGLWGRGRKSEMLTKALGDAADQQTGLENGIRIQFRSILKSPKKKRFFKDTEIKEMQRIVRGDKKANLFRLLGTLGFSLQQGRSIVGNALGISGAAAGFAAGGGTGAALVSGIGSGSQFISKIITEGRANLFNDLIRAGKNARGITQAYLKNTPAKERSPRDLSELLSSPDLDLLRLPKTDLISGAVQLARENQRAILRGVVGTETVRDTGLSLELSLAQEEQ